MKLHDLSPAKGSTQRRKRVGRGPGSGLGKTSGKGHKGGKSRSGYSQNIGFEGGQMSLIRRVPKRGFTNIFRREYAVVSIAQLAALAVKNKVAEITVDALVLARLAHRGMPVKILGDGEIKQALTVIVDKFSASGRAKIEAAGGRCEERAR